MSEIIGLGVTHYPGLYAEEEHMADILRRTLAAPSAPERVKHSANWPDAMRQEWGADKGIKAARLHRERCFSAFRTVRDKLDSFKPDLVLVFGDDQYENFIEDIVPPFCLYILDEIESRPFGKDEDDPDGVPNIWKEPPSAVFRHRGHPEAARYIANRLCDAGMHLPYAYRLRHHKGLAHAFINTLMFLDVDRKGFELPVVPFHINCYGGSLVRSQGGRLPQGEAGEEPDPPAPSSAACYDLGRALARVLAASPWRVALIASSSWSHAFLTRKNDWLYPDHDSDRARLEELREGRLREWRDLSRRELEEAGQHEMLNWVVLAGAMTELRLQVQIVDYVETYVLNSNKCFASWV